LHYVLLSTENAQQKAALRQYTPQARPPFWLLKLVSDHVHARLLPRMSWSWTVLLPSNTHRKPITSITAVLLPFVAYWLSISLHCAVINILRIIRLKRISSRNIQDFAGRRVGVRFPAELRDLSVLHSVQTGFGARPAFYPLGIGWSIPWGK
jgi:hypothetical protein